LTSVAGDLWAGTIGPPAATRACKTSAMEWLGWLVIGLLAGSISGWVVGLRSVQGCLPTIVVGILGGVVGGWLAQQMGLGQGQGFVGALVLATLGAILVRIVLRAIETGP
jgi:uncharacterized membrane protein YeaQ/YmgE (transglycosylase-associated protein family)